MHKKNKKPTTKHKDVKAIEKKRQIQLQHKKRKKMKQRRKTSNKKTCNKNKHIHDNFIDKKQQIIKIEREIKAHAKGQKAKLQKHTKKK